MCVTSVLWCLVSETGIGSDVYFLCVSQVFCGVSSQRQELEVMFTSCVSHKCFVCLVSETGVGSDVYFLCVSQMFCGVSSQRQELEVMFTSCVCHKCFVVSRLRDRSWK